MSGLSNDEVDVAMRAASLNDNAAEDAAESAAGTEPKNQADEEEVLQLGGGHESQRGQEPQEVVPRQRGQAERG